LFHLAAIIPAPILQKFYKTFAENILSLRKRRKIFYCH
jgi:hypothetical protein